MENSGDWLSRRLVIGGIVKKFLKALAVLGLVSVALIGNAQTWTRITTRPSFGAGVPLLLTDGTVLVHNADTADWWKLTPSNTGSYVNGTWSQMASLPNSYGPLYYASAVLADGRVIVIGGEYNFGSGVWTNKGAVYTPTTNTWAILNAPAGWSQIGDAQCTVLPNGHFLLAHPFDTLMADLDPVTMTWTSVGSGKTDRFDEEGWTLLPNGTILTVDAINAPATERYLPSTGQWISAGSTPQSLCQPSSQEIGPAVLMYDGRVFATGATGHNAIYTPGSTLTAQGTWVAAPDFPIIGSQLDIADGPACLLPNGNVFCGASPGVFNAPTAFFEFDGTSLLPRPATPNSATNPSYVGNMLMLPTGQVMYTDFTTDIQFYTPAGGPNNAWRPTITACPTALTPGGSFVIQGTQFNGLSECSAYGDDSSNASNYPLVRVTNATTAHVAFGRTFNHSTMGVATGAALVSTNVAVPAGIETGVSTVQVVTNGIASTGVEVLVGNVAPTITTISPTSTVAPGSAFTLTVNGTQFLSTDTVTWTTGSGTTSLGTTKISVGQLNAAVPASLLTAGVTATIQVKRANGTLSNTVTFTVNNPAPTLTAISPNTAVAGSAGLTLAVTGTNFVSTSVVQWNGLARTTTFVDSTHLTALITTADLATVASTPVTVKNSTPGGGTSSALPFTTTPIEIVPTAAQPMTHSLESGTFADLALSDNIIMNLSASARLFRDNQTLKLDITGATTATTANRIDVKFETSTSRAGMVLTASAFDFVSNAWVPIGTYATTTADTTQTVSMTTNAGRYVGPAGVKLRLEVGDVPGSRSAEFHVDFVHWTLYP